MDAETVDRINALQTEIRVLDGQGGGYTEQDKQNAKLVLMDIVLSE